MKLSTIVITRNQRWNVERLVGSVRRATDWLGDDHELVVVDSASTDGTAEAALAAGATTLVLSPGQRLTAAAGRYVGFENTTGDAVLFLDGDMEVIPGWIGAALEALDSDATITAIAGERIDLPLDADTSDAEVPALSEAPRFEDVLHGGGAAIYRRSVLEEIGSFNPFVFSDEEPELCIRIRYQHGSRVVKLNHPIVLHFTDPPSELSTLVRRSGRNLFVGQGQNIRMLLGTDLLAPYVRERGRGLAPIAWAACGVGAGMAAVSLRTAVPLAGWACASVLGGSALVARQRSFKRASHRALQRGLMGIGTIRGFMLTPHAPSEYPASFTRLDP